MTVPEERHLTSDEILEVLHFIGFPLEQADKLPAPTLETLTEFQYRAMTTIPFETLSLRLTKERHVDITLDGILDRVLRQRRGGWCFSLNRLCYEVLRGLGFKAQWVIARVCKPLKYGDPLVYGPPTHRTTLVLIEDKENNGGSVTTTFTKYLVDIGFGASPYKPIELREGAEVEYFGHRRRMSKVVHNQANTETLGNPVEEMWRLEEWMGRGRWGPCYAFTESQAYEVDAEMSNWYTCHSPNSFCSSRFWVMKGTADGKYLLLMQNDFKIRSANGTEFAMTCKTEKEREHVLEKYFNIHLTDEERECNDQKLP
ncbi:N-terminal acetyltransferase [Actinomortierella ambigua]|uniref:N-terminal acetyltransferase n=1 Tax=Actinomortierella ambigua TaxID=1343610 RepID=A0A9P6U6U8_9FUNG|nr:N-terminal acetyltransferase [Actinomortierella ambigua]